MKLQYVWSKVFKKIRGSAVLKSSIHPTSKIESGSNIVNTTMGKHSFCGYNCDINNTEIGSFCSIANNVVIGGGMHPIDWVSTSPVFYSGRDSVRAKFSEFDRVSMLKTKIGHDVWIGQNVLIKQGVIIGNGSVIGMGSVVTKNVEPYSIIGGVPAKLIKMRFEEVLVERLLNSEWWNKDDNKLKNAAKYIQNPKMFLTLIEE